MFKNIFALFVRKNKATIPVAKEFVMDFASTSIVFWSIDRKVQLASFNEFDKKSISNWLSNNSYYVQEYFETVI